MQNGIDKSKRQVKYSVNLKGSLRAVVKVFTEPASISENVAMAELINEADYIKGDVVVFDRGLQTRRAFDTITFEGKLFTGRSKTAVKHTLLFARETSDKRGGATLTVTIDVTGYLFGDLNKQTQNRYRIIKGVIDKSGDDICLITNILDEKAYLVAQWYKQRWEIEIFFKLIRQPLHAGHWVSRILNGMNVRIYRTMITAILMLAYKKINKFTGYKIAKLKFETKLETDFIKPLSFSVEVTRTKQITSSQLPESMFRTLMV